MTTKNGGTNSTARQVDASMPVNTVMPIDTRALAPAPLASTSGTTPRMKANDVITIGRNRARAASVAASRIGLPAARSSRANSTMRIAFFAESAISKNEPDLNVEVVVEPALDEGRERHDRPDERQ